MLKQFDKKYTYTLLRYMPDIATGEFVNLGLLLFSKENNFVAFKLVNTTKRITQVFPKINGRNLQSLLKSLAKVGEKLNHEVTGLDFGNFKNALEAAERILPNDDGALQWSPAGSGKTSDLEGSATKLFKRLVSPDVQPEHKSLTDDDAWRIFSKTLAKRNLLPHLKQVKIDSDLDEVTFKHAWKNGIWHCMEPISFDLHNQELIKSKARKLVGQMYFMTNSKEKFKLYLLLAKPRSKDMQAAYISARKMLEKMPIETVCYAEDEVETLATQMEQQILHHSQQSH